MTIQLAIRICESAPSVARMRREVWLEDVKLSIEGNDFEAIGMLSVPLCPSDVLADDWVVVE